jgi:hypothetical protein
MGLRICAGRAYGAYTSSAPALAAFDNPELVVACVVGDGEAETGPLAASWYSNKFLDPARDGLRHCTRRPGLGGACFGTEHRYVDSIDARYRRPVFTCHRGQD